MEPLCILIQDLIFRNKLQTCISLGLCTWYNISDSTVAGHNSSILVQRILRRYYNNIGNTKRSGFTSLLLET